MSQYELPKLPTPRSTRKHQVLLIANGDLRTSANQKCWAAQEQMEKTLTAAVADMGYELIRAHPYKPDQKHGFIGSQ